MTIDLNVQTVILASSALGAIFALARYGDKIINWLKKPSQQEEKLVKLEKHHEEDMQSLKSEMTLIMYGVLASLKGLKEQGCNGPVTEAIEKIDKYLNQKAHE